MEPGRSELRRKEHSRQEESDEIDRTERPEQLEGNCRDGRGWGVGELSAWCEAEGISRGRGPRGSRSSRSF